MLTVYRRHLKTCDHRGKGKDKGRDYRRCKCPVWVDGFLSGRDLRQSLKMRDFQKATEKVREWEARGTVEEEKEDAPITIEHACAEFLRDAQARELREPTLYKYRLLFRRLQEFASQRLALCRRVELGDCAVRDGKLFLYTAKTGTAVWCPLPPSVTEALEAIPGERYFFGRGSRIRKVVWAIGSDRSAPFSVWRVCPMATHTGSATHSPSSCCWPGCRSSGYLFFWATRACTEKHYTPWVKARQEQLESDVRRTWNTDLVALAETKGTPEVHGRSERPN